MTVFKTIFKIINKIKGMLILYTVIILSITLLNQTPDSNTLNFEAAKPDILIIDKYEEDYLTKGFKDYISKNSKIIDIDISNEEEINDALFYRQVNFIIYIPENFSEELLKGNVPEISYKETGDYYSSYSKMLIEKYINAVLVYKDYYQNDELVEKVSNLLETSIDTEIETKLDTNKLDSATRYFNFLNYALLAGCVYCISNVLASLKSKKVYKRTIISNYNFNKYNRIVVLSNFILIISMYLLYMLLGIMLFKDLMFTLNGVLFMLNTFIFALCALTIGYLIGNMTQNKNAIGGIINVVALGSSFLCGCFVPIQYLPQSVINLGHIFPTYYFIQNNEIIKGLETLNFDSIKPIIINSGIIVIFIVGFIIATNIIIKRKRKIG